MTNIVAQAQPRSLNGPEKVAALLLALDREVSQRVLKHFDQGELKRIAKFAASLGSVPTSALEFVIDELIDEITSGDVDLIGNAGQAEQLLSGVIPEEQVADIMSDVRGSSNDFFWKRVSSLPEKTFSGYLCKEHPQTVAAVISKVDAAYAAKLLGHLPGPLRSAVMRRMLVSKPLSDAVLRALETALHDDLFATSSAPSSSEVNARVAGIINRLDRDQIEEILRGITETEPVIAAQLKYLLFSFEDVIKLGKRARTILFDQVPTDRLILALRGTEANLREAVLPCLSARTRRMVEAEISTPDLPPKRDIVSAQRQIAETVLRLLEQGVIEINAPEAPADESG